MANEKRRLIDANALMAEMKECSEGLDKYYCGYAKAFIDQTGLDTLVVHAVNDEY